MGLLSRSVVKFVHFVLCLVCFVYTSNLLVKCSVHRTSGGGPSLCFGTFGGFSERHRG